MKINQSFILLIFSLLLLCNELLAFKCFNDDGSDSFCEPNLENAASNIEPEIVHTCCNNNNVCVNINQENEYFCGTCGPLSNQFNKSDFKSLTGTFKYCDSKDASSTLFSKGKIDFPTAVNITIDFHKSHVTKSIQITFGKNLPDNIEIYKKDSYDSDFTFHSHYESKQFVDNSVDSCLHDKYQVVYIPIGIITTGMRLVFNPLNTFEITDIAIFARFTMLIDPARKTFLVLFSVLVLGVIGFLIASIFIDFTGDVEIISLETPSVNLSTSNFRISLIKRKSDKEYLLSVYNDGNWLQDILLGTDFGDRNVEVVEIQDGFKVRTNEDNEISFTIDLNTEDFSTIYVKRKFTSKASVVTDCLHLQPDTVNWYGGPEQMDQRYPIQKFEFEDYAYVLKELEAAAVMERYWLSSNGFFILIDYEAPLFIDQNTNDTIDHICFTGKKELPYYTHNEEFEFNYRIGASKNAKETHLNVVNHLLGKPKGYPNEDMVRYPIWNSWVRYGRPINEQMIADYADEIIAHGFNRSLFDIDDFWEVCYGSLEVNQTTFPGLRSLAEDLKSKGFIVGMWIHPFVNKDCEPYFTYLNDNNFLVKSHSGSLDTSWWNSGPNEAAHIDFSNPEARSYFRQSLENLQNQYSIDIFKFDAGETTWYPEDPVLTGDPALWPSSLSRSYLELASDFGDKLEVRSAWGTQHLHIFVRMLDFDSRWGVDNGLASLIPTLIQFNMNGYPFVLPDMIGGNQYWGEVISKELFIRWLQATVFMPSLQFSVVPWQYDGETIDLSLELTSLHADYADYIIERFEMAVSDGHPVNPPIWWLDPEDKTAQTIEDEFLLGEKILAAPIVIEGATTRNIYLPVGSWKDGNSETVYEGPIWIEDYPAPLDTLPYFIREDMV
ncbi:CLUMA_CG008450, isoform A [Clunio marinus]|uniref:CLUMA_CG008450, isoform A n=1 Tax=Clunio marinus TaxID=568069 RepID=A0A1J1I5E1_9DIPT|nr:CLUMA_CG008450, isoform A [Clunio marinus]